jgi:hypothetical protein
MPREPYEYRSFSSKYEVVLYFVGDKEQVIPFKHEPSDEMVKALIEGQFATSARVRRIKVEARGVWVR